MKPGLSSAGLQTVASVLREIREEWEADNRLLPTVMGGFHSDNQGSHASGWLHATCGH